MSRRAQNAGSAAVLILIVSAALVFYILLLSPEDRASLLDDTGTSTTCQGTNCQQQPNTILLLSQNIGRIEVSGPDGVSHTIPSFTVETKTDARELKRVPALRIERSAFSQKEQRVEFQIDKEFTDNALLSFTAPTREGQLIIVLNGIEIYHAPITEESPQPIQLPKESLVYTNELVFRVTSPGLAFWKKNVMDLRNVLISGIVTDISQHQSQNQVALSDTEYQNLDTAKLQFVPNCDSRNAGRLAVLINNQLVYSAKPDCGSVSSTDIGKDLLKPGTKWKSDRCNAPISEAICGSI
ncbi:MAG: hypothetical protein ABIA93_02280 [Candidatus Woesearchaeota archaeon]